MAIQSTLLGAGKAMMAMGMMQFGPSPSPLRLVLTTTGSSGPWLGTISPSDFLPSSGNYPAAGIEIANMRVVGVDSTTAAVKADNIPLIGVNMTVRTGFIYLPGTFTGFPSMWGPPTVTDPIVAKIDFAYGASDLEVNGDLTIAWPDGNLFVLA